LFAQRLQQFDAGVGQVDENGGDAVLGQGLGLGHGGTQHAAVKLGGGGEVGHRDGDVIETADHRPPSSA